jgi:hypothetical protein
MGALYAYFWKLVNICGLILGRYSLIGIASRYGLNGPGIESRWGARSSAPVETHVGAHRGYRGIHGGKAAGAWLLPPSPIYRRS